MSPDQAPTERSPLSTARIVAFVPTRNPIAARDFYYGVLGLELIAEDQYALVIDAGGVMLRITTVLELEPAKHTVLGWDVPDIVSAVKALGNRGVTFERYEGIPQDDLGIWTSPSGARVAWFKDPDGNTLSVTQF